MKIKYLAIFIFLLSCSKSAVERNPYLPERKFSYVLNLNLPAYNALKYPQNTVLIPNIGIKGVFVTSVGNGRFVAWEVACPNHYPSDCEQLMCASKNGDIFTTCSDSNSKSYIFVTCPCDKNVYNLINGSLIFSEKTERQFPLLNYAVSVSGTNLTISN